ncbi:MAG: NAD-dependent epimerase/dehydratase family protein, partial [Candidatus Babeliales bacterium]
RKEIKALLHRIGVDETRVTLWGSGSVFREFLHVDDLAQAALFIAETCDYQDIGECINVGSGLDRTISSLVEIVRDVVAYRGDIHFDTSKPDGTPRKLLDVSRLQKLGWRASVEILDGVLKLYRWYAELPRSGREQNVKTTHQSF